LEIPFAVLRRELARGLRIQAQVTYALILRETRARFGRTSLGYLWAVIQPLVLVAIMAGMMSLGLRHSVPPGMSLLSFLATGLLSFHFFSDINARVSNAAQSNGNLLYYPRILPIDLLSSQFALEFATQVVAFVVVLGGEALYFERLTVDYPLQVFGGLFLAAGLGLGTGLVMGALGSMYPAVNQVRSALFRPLFFVSGAWFTANELPPQIREVLLYNPVLHCIELVRGGWFRSYDPRYADPLYPLTWVVALVGVGLTLERVARRTQGEGTA
jgi:capsular polysaccharide transport system permease protein